MTNIPCAIYSFGFCAGQYGQRVTCRHVQSARRLALFQRPPNEHCNPPTNRILSWNLMSSLMVIRLPLCRITHRRQHHPSRISRILIPVYMSRWDRDLTRTLEFLTELLLCFPIHIVASTPPLRPLSQNRLHIRLLLQRVTRFLIPLPHLRRNMIPDTFSGMQRRTAADEYRRIEQRG